LLADPDNNVRSSTAWALSRIGAENGATIPALIGMLADRDPTVRLWAAWALGSIGPPARAAVPALMEIIQRRERYVQDQAAWALGRFGPGARDAVPVLITMLHDNDADARQSATWALGSIGPAARDAVPAVLTLLEEELSSIGRIEAALTLWKVDGRCAGLPILTEAVNDPDFHVRRFAAEALACMGPVAHAAVPNLRQLLDSQPRDRRLKTLEREALEAAALALRKLDPELARQLLGDEDSDQT
jgi:HEAT repeat protein